MWVLRRVARRHTLVAVAAIITLLAVGGGTAGACKLALDCRGLLGRAAGDADPLPVVAPGGGSFTSGFAERVVARGLVEPTDFAFLPDGRILVAEKRGLVRMIVGGRMGRRPVLDLRGGVSTYQLRGLITVGVDPDFPRRPYIYVLRTLPTGRGEAAPTTARLSRFTLAGPVARRSSEVVVLGRVAGGRS